MSRPELDAFDLDPDPVEQFRRWLADAVAARLPEPTAATLATATAGGRPSARIVLLKDVDARGFVFGTNYGSRKASELAENPWAGLVFHWQPLECQVRVEGPVDRTSAAESDALFRPRPRGAQLGAWASRQSRVIADRRELDDSLRELETAYPGVVPRPDFWGGFRLQPESIEFWRGRPDRLHDRLRYWRQPGGGWRVERLAP